jgi:TPR repeat protein
MRPAIVNIVILMFFVTLMTACAPNYRKLASESLKQERFEEAVGYLKECSNQGYARCDYRLGMMLLSGQGVERDVTAARNLFFNAATKGIPEAQLELGRLFTRGEGVEKNPGKAVFWYRKAADAGIPEAQSQLGVLFADGEGVEQNEVIAADWYRKAANANDPLGQAALGIATFNGLGVQKDIVEGYMWTKLAANQGNEKALSILPTMEAELTGDELVIAQSKVRKFRPESAEKRQRTNTSHLGRNSWDRLRKNAEQHHPASHGIH